MNFSVKFILLIAVIGGILPDATNAQTAYPCPAAGASTILPIASPSNETTIRLPKISASDGLCILLRRSTTDGKKRAHVARSYAHRDWEQSAGLFAKTDSGVAVDCTSGSATECDVTLPALSADEEYVLESHEYSTSTEVEAARFLEQATFGGRLSDIQALASTANDFKSWIHDQMFVKPASSLRAFYRQHTNPKFEFPYNTGAVSSTPCQQYSRWRRYALCSRDMLSERKPIADQKRQKYLKIKREIGVDGNYIYVWYVDNLFRTVTSTRPKFGRYWKTMSLKLNFRYRIGNTNGQNWNADCLGCSVPLFDSVADDDGENNGEVYYVSNPPISFANVPSFILEYNVVNLPELNSIDLPSIDNGDEWPVFSEWFHPNENFILNTTDLEDTNQCDGHPSFHFPILQPNTNEAPMGAFPTVFGMSPDGQHFAYDSHLAFQENTVENPLVDGGGQLSINTYGLGTDVASPGETVLCQNVEPNFLNEDGCKLSYHSSACKPGEDPTPVIELTEDSVAGMREKVGEDIYIMKDIDMSDLVLNVNSGKDAPCGDGVQGSRWMMVEDTACENSAALDGDTIKLFRSLLDARSEGPLNSANIVDVKKHAHGMQCSSSDKTKVVFGNILASDGSCWRHVHWNERSVIDFSQPPLNPFPVLKIVGDNVGSTPMTNLAPCEGDCDRDSDCLTGLKCMQRGGNEAVPGCSGPGESGKDYCYSFAVTPAPTPPPSALGAGTNLEDYENPPGSSYVTVPSSWGHGSFHIIGKLGEYITLDGVSEPHPLQDAEVQDTFKSVILNPLRLPVLICGSPDEVASDPFNGDQGFDIVIPEKEGFRTRSIGELSSARHTTWTHLGLHAVDALRQKMAWALSQVVAVGLGGSGMVFYEPTEQYVSFYDIFTRNAFGNYRDIMKEFSFNKIMAEWLSFKGNKSLQYNIDTINEANYPDENFAREIMQLFSIGLYKLNPDGSFALENGNPAETYTIEDIVSYSKTWTGFSGRGKRGGTSTSGRQGDDSLDPMQIIGEWRDLFPKSNLEGGFIGDRSVPLCTDLPSGHALRKGAVWKLSGSNPRPEYQEDPYTWGPEIKRLELDPSSTLFDKLCSPNLNGDCTFPSKIVLGENIYDTAEMGAEYTVDTIRTVQLKKAGLSTPIYYEHIRQPCVEHSFYSDAVKLMQGEVPSSGVQGYPSICGDPRLPIATPMCCSSGWETNAEYGHIYCNYQGERMTYSSAQVICVANGEESCQPGIMEESLGGECSFGSQSRHFRSWTPKSCELRAKIDFSSGYVAIVHAPEPDFAGQSNVEPMVDNDTLNFFKVAWTEEGFPSSLNDCVALPSCFVHGGNSCICSTDVTDQQVFSSSTEVTSAVDLIAALHTGAVDPTAFDAGTYQLLGDCNIDGVDLYTKAGGTCSSLSSDTIFALEVKSKKFFLKNSKSTVHLFGTSYSFRNPVQFNNLADPEVRDMYSETDEVIDSLFYHPSHAPFLAYRIIQRFGISNPSPSFIERVVVAYSTGLYQGIGSGKYGDLAAMVAAILLDDETRQVVLDADQSHGHIREPLVKVMSLFRSIGISFNSPLRMQTLMGLEGDIGQGSFESPSVFSFFLPEFIPNTPALQSASLVAPESMVLSGDLVLTLLDSMYNTIKFGVTETGYYCKDQGPGFDAWRSAKVGNFGFKIDGPPDTDHCTEVEGDTSLSPAVPTYEPPPGATVDEVLDELAIILTAGRLTEQNRALIRSVIVEYFPDGTTGPTGPTPSPTPPVLTIVGDNEEPASAFPLGACEGDCDNDDECQTGLKCMQRGGTEAVPGCSGSGISRKDYCYSDGSMPTQGDIGKAVRIAQQLMLSTPEFHATSLPRRQDQVRQFTGYENQPAAPYKALVVFMMIGGCDSFNLLVPKGQCSTGNGYDEYKSARGSHALEDDKLIPIMANSQQNCQEFAVNKKFKLLSHMYNQGDALFFANTGVLSKPMTKHDDWAKETSFQLFAHNTMLHEAATGDPYEVNAGTGVFGRMLDILKLEGYHTSANSVGASGEGALTGDQYYGNPVWTVSDSPPDTMNKIPTISNLIDLAKELNGVGENNNNYLSESWSAKLGNAFFEYEQQQEISSLPEFEVTGYPAAAGSLAAKFKAIAGHMKSRSYRKVDRDVYFITQRGYDLHAEDTLSDLLEPANNTLTQFTDWLKTENLWDSTAILMESDFGRSLNPNSNGGTDHAWGGNYFLLGGKVAGGKILGEFPSPLSPDHPNWIGRGRFIPTLPWDSVWNGIAQWLGVTSEEDLNWILPNRGKFNNLLSGSDLFVDGPSVPPPTTAPPPGPTPPSPTPPSLPPTPPPTTSPIPDPTSKPTDEPTPGPTAQPTTGSPTMKPTPQPTTSPIPDPTSKPTDEPTPGPTAQPTTSPIPDPTSKPTDEPTSGPTAQPTTGSPTMKPTPQPTTSPIPDPTSKPTDEPTPGPTAQPTTGSPTMKPTPQPTNQPMQLQMFQIYEAEDQTVWDETRIYNNLPGANGSYVKMTSSAGDYIEWPNIDGGAGEVCVLNFRHSLGKNGVRNSPVTVNGVYSGDAYFVRTGGWDSWKMSMLAVPCNAGPNNVIRLTSGSNGGPAIDYLQVTVNPQPIIPGRYEAEYGLKSVGPTTFTSDTSDMGVDAYVKMYSTAGDYIEWSNIDGGAGEVCVLNFRFALGKNGVRNSPVTVNGVHAGDAYFEGTGGWDSWKMSMLAVPCNAGPNNVIRLTSGSNGGPAIDYLQVTANPQPIIPGRYEAEYGLKSVGPTTFTSDTSDMGVDAYVQMYSTAGDYIEWSNIDGGAGGTCTLNFRFALGRAGARDCSVTVNGVHAGDISVLFTGSWSSWQITSLSVPCNAGSNNVIRVAGGSNGGPAFDYLEVIAN